MKYVGLLTDEQKRAGFFIGQDEDFIYLFRRNGKATQPICIAIYPYDFATVKEIRDEAEEVLNDNSNSRL